MSILIGSVQSQIAFLFGFIIIGYILTRSRILSENSAAVLSKLENTVFIPALVLKTFIGNFTIARISSAWKLLLISSVIAIVVIPLSILASKSLTKDKYIQKIYTYGLSFSNFGFMGNAVVSALFPDIFFEYLIFTLPLWTLIYLWGVPKLLLIDFDKKQTFKESLKSFINPMFVAMLIGMLIGLSGLKLPQWTHAIISVSGDCMSPIAMILTGIVVASISLKKTFTNVKIYIVSVIRLIVFPLIFVVAACFFEMPENIYICALCSLAMPLGLNTIVIPSALGKDVSVAAGMALISHLLSCITIPIIFAI